jgi:hypothetical protein
MILKFLRLLKIFTVATRYGLDEIAMSGFNVPRTARFINTMFFWRRITSPRAIRLRLALEELGPIFVKFGQVLSTRPDLMPEDIVAELSLLQDRVPPFDSDLARSRKPSARRRINCSRPSSGPRWPRPRSPRCTLRPSRTARKSRSRCCVPA